MLIWDATKFMLETYGVFISAEKLKEAIYYLLYWKDVEVKWYVESCGHILVYEWVLLCVLDVSFGCMLV